MPNFKPQDFFNMKTTSPGTLKQFNLISFNYQSPRGIHDPNPMVLVVNKEFDRIFGFNLHYDMSEVQQILTNTDNKVMKFIEEQYYRKYPENKQKLLKEHKQFSKELVTQQEYKEFIRKMPSKDLEVYQVEPPSIEICRCYLFKRMNSVSKLTWKTD